MAEQRPAPGGSTGAAGTTASASAAAAAALADAQAEMRLLVRDIEDSDGHLPSTLRTVFERQLDPEAFVTVLEEAYRERDKEIEKKCTDNYDKFVSSISDLLDLQESATGTREAMEECREMLDARGQQLAESAHMLAETRRMQRNILDSIEALSACIPVLRLFDHAETQLAHGRYYPALKSLQQLEAAHLPRVQKYGFARIMRQRVPRMRAKVKAAAFDDMRAFLSKIREHGCEIGAMAMKQKVASKTGGESLSDSKAKFEVAASDKVDFAPLYRCLHLCQVLGVLPEAAKYYKEERSKQADLLLHPVAAMASTAGYRKYFSDVAGFFLVEDTVLSTTKGFITRQWVDGVWQAALIAIDRVMEQQLAKCSTASMISDIKDVIVQLKNTLLDYDYSVAKLVDILLHVRARYDAVLTTALAEGLRAILEGDDFGTCTVDNEEEYRAIIARYPLEDRSFLEAPFPKTFPFSRAVPECYATLRQFVEQTFEFLRHIGLSNTDVDDMVRQSTNHLLSKVLSPALTALVHGRLLTLPQLTQISVNTTHLELLCSALEKHITSLTGAIANNTHTQKLHGADYFKDARQAAERRIFALLQQQIDQFLDLAEYDWAPAQPKTDSSEYIFDLLAYLTTIFASLTNLPIDVGRAAYFDTCKYISARLLDLVQSPEIKRINMNGIRSFAKDVETCEAYAENCPLVGADDQLFKNVFIHLRELVNVFLHDDWEAYCDEAQRREKYPYLRPQIALQWLEKYEENDHKSKKNSEGRKKSREMEIVIRRLKALVAAQSSSS